MHWRCLNCWQVLFLLLFLTQIICQRHFWDVIAYAWLLFVFVLWSICLSSSLVHFKNDPEYLTRWIAQVFTPFIRFQQYSFVLSSFLVLRYCFLNFFFHLHLFDGVSFLYSQVFVRFLFLGRSNFFLIWFIIIIIYIRNTLVGYKKALGNVISYVL